MKNKLYLNSIATTFAIICASVPVAAIAQSAPDDAEDAADSGVEIIVTAQKRSELAKDVPISITSASAEFLKSAGISDLRDINMMATSVVMSTQGPFLNPSLRGISTSVTGTDSASIAIYVDGVYSSSKSGNVFATPDVSRIEIAKGPQGTLFGRNATGGAIQVFTRDPEFEFTGFANAIAGIGGHGDRRGGANAFITGPISDTLAVSVTGAYEKSRGYYVNEFDGRRLGTEDFMTRAKLLFQPSDGVSILAHFSYSDRHDESAQARLPFNGNALARAIDPNVFLPSLTDRYRVNNSLADFRVKNLRASLTADFDLSFGQLTSLTAYTESNTSVADEDGDSSPLVLADYNNPTIGKTKIQELTFASDQFGRFSFIAGVNAYFNTQQSNPDLRVNGNFFSLYARQKTEAYAAFAELTYKLTDRATIVAGARYSHENRQLFGRYYSAPVAKIGEKNFSDVTPRASIRYAISDRTNVYATFTRGFASGIFNPDSLSPLPADPEAVSAYEVGLKTSKGGSNLAVAAFYYDYKDLQLNVLLNSGLVTYVNAASAKIFGLEAEGNLQLTDSLDFRGGISWLQKAKYSDYPNALVQVPTGAGGNTLVSFDGSGLRMIRAPKVTANAALTYKRRFNSGTLDGSLVGFYSSTYNLQLVGRVKQNAYVDLNSEIGWTFGDRGLRVALYGRNLTDYRNYIQNFFDGAGGDNASYGGPREVGLKLGFEF
jgi:iron complex outermembrane receptor protein